MAGGGSGGGTSGNLLGPAYPFTSPGPLTTDAADNLLIPVMFGRGTPVGRIRGFVRVPPAGDDIVIDIHRILLADGSIIDTIGTLTIPDGDFTATAVLLIAVTILETQGLVAEIVNVGTAPDPGETLTVMVD